MFWGCVYFVLKICSCFSVGLSGWCFFFSRLTSALPSQVTPDAFDILMESKLGSEDVRRGVLLFSWFLTMPY